MSKYLDFGGIPTSLGEIINIKYHLDTIKNNYDVIKLSFHKALWSWALHTEAPDWAQKKAGWDSLLNELGQLFFSEKPYVLLESSPKFGGDIGVLCTQLRITPQKAEMAHLLCKGNPLNLGEPYIVLTTKVRQLSRRNFIPLSIKLWQTLQKLSKKYKIVVLGERTVEMRKEYGAYPDGVFGLYEEIIANLPQDRIMDLTLPALGETVSTLAQIQQDCLIMRDAKFVVTIGVGGNFCMATSVANMVIGYRDDNLDFTNRIFNREYPNAIITKNWGYFISKLESYL